MAFLWAGFYGPEDFRYSGGRTARNIAATLYEAGTTTLATRYADRDRTGGAQANPWTTDDLGNLSLYAEPGFYDLKVGETTFRIRVDPDPAEEEADDAAAIAAHEAAANPHPGYALDGDVAAVQAELDQEEIDRAAGDVAVAAAAAADATTKANAAQAAAASDATTKVAAEAAARAAADAAILDGATFTGEIVAPDFKATGITGAVQPTRYVGATVTGAPASGTFEVGDFIVTQGGGIYVCTVAGTPGTWVGLAPTNDVQVFTSSGTWTKPSSPRYTTAEIICITGGGGGGSGRRGAAGTVRCGGGGGGGGSMSIFTVRLSDLGPTETITVAAGGTGGAAVTANDTDGNAGAGGGASAMNGVTRAGGGGGGGGGTATAGTAGAAGVSQVGGGLGGTASATGGSGNLGGTAPAGTGGGGGGGISSGNTPNAGGNAGINTGVTNAGLATSRLGGVGGAINIDGAYAVTESAVGQPLPSVGGGGGGASIVGAGGSGAAGSRYGGGGGGGGAALNGANSGKGGDGGSGLVVVICR